MEKFIHFSRPSNHYNNISIRIPQKATFNTIQTYRKHLTQEADQLLRNINIRNNHYTHRNNEQFNFKKIKELREESSKKISSGTRIRSISNFNCPASPISFKEITSMKDYRMQEMSPRNIINPKFNQVSRKCEKNENNVLLWSKSQRRKSRRLTGLTDYDKKSNLQSTLDVPRKQNKDKTALPTKALEFRRSLSQLYRKFSKPAIEGTIGMENNSIRKSDFEIGRKLGSGNFSTAYLVRHIKTRSIYALKIMQKEKIISERYEQQVVRQIKIQFYLSHKNLVELYAVFEDKKNVYLLMQYCCEGQLFNLIRKENRLEQESALPIIKGISKGIEFIHNEMVIHRDLKPENIFLSFGVPKIGDFGWAVYTGGNEYLRNTTSGSPLYYSPEIVQKQGYDDKIDIWGLGVIAFECLIGMAPFKIYSLMNLDRIIYDEVDFPSYVDISEQAIEFIKCCLKKKPEQRWNISRLLRHRFMSEGQ